MRSIKGKLDEKAFKEFRLMCVYDEINHPDGFKRAVGAWVQSNNK